MKHTCEGCVWYGNCDGTVRCSYYDPVDETEEVETKESRLDKREFRKEWLLYMNADNDVDYCEQPVVFYGDKLSKTKGGD